MSAEADRGASRTQLVRVSRAVFQQIHAPPVPFDEAATEFMYYLVHRVARARGLSPEVLETSRLARSREVIPLQAAAWRRAFERAFDSLAEDWERAPSAVEDLGVVYEALIASPTAGRKGLANQTSARKRSGSFYTPLALAETVVAEALARHLAPEAISRCLELKIVDPAAGAGVFLLQVCRQLAARWAEASGVSLAEARREVAQNCLYGADSNALSVAVLEACLWLFVGDGELAPGDFDGRLFHGDALLGHDLASAPAQTRCEARLEGLRPGLRVPPIDWRAVCPHPDRGFDVVCGNPPWVAFAGRSAQPLPKPVRDYYSRSYASWRGFPTLHGLFVERACELAPKGTVALLMPSPVADLDGYRFVRRRLTRGHRIRERLLEFGQDAFDGVTQPCFALVADSDPRASESEERWSLSERQRASGVAEVVRVPESLVEMRRARPRLPSEAFGEYGFQTSRVASETLLLRGDQPDELHECPLLEGRNVKEFHEGEPRLFLRADPDLLKKARCRLRSRDQYRTVDFVVRQTAPVPIAALHGGLPFRNSLLGGFARPGLSAALLVGLLNSTLYRALHLATQRDARQAAFPQVKLAHLRDLPAPPDDTQLRQRVETITLEMSKNMVSSELALELDQVTFELFELDPAARIEIREFVKGRAPKYAR